ncbi:MAG: family 10 glycosylhydrolase [Bacteroidaceae bacterium]|nr:family 10 glycosylhydrolase [Bacteroidaceae bacterium]MBQ6050890.1 family 10 glycosylhydrolase [Bacteroidaceae bacterium]MBR3547061.1 family 10 glycosylhydrolase [Bacteroidaceae bacterium]
MKRIIHTIYALFLCILVNAQTLFTNPEVFPKREVRAVWLTTFGGLDWPKTKATNEWNREAQQEELCDILDQLKECGINTVLLQVRTRGTVLYPSNIEPWDVVLTGKYDKDPGYDPLAFAIEETHKRGMELHAWIVAIPSFKAENARRIGRKSLIYTHPRLLKKHGDTYYLDPGLPGTADYLERLCHEIVENYDVDGIHLDYIRYPENSSSFPDSYTYKIYGDGMSKADWRRENITAVVQQIYHTVKELKPWVRVSCSPVGKYDDVTRYSARGWSAYSTVFQDAQGWLKLGIMDMLFPMMYFQGDHFYPFAADWQERSYGRSVVPGLGIYFLSPKEQNWDLGVIKRELAYLRLIDVGGEAYFRSQFLTKNEKGIYDYLKSIYYPYPAIMPAMTWQHDVTPAAPDVQVKRTGPTTVRLSWQPVRSGGSTCRYIIYASREMPVDISNPANLITIVSEPEYTYNLLTATLWNLHLAVTTLDRYGNESLPHVIDINLPKN